MDAMKKSNMKLQEVGPSDGLPQISSANTEPTYIEATSIDSEVITSYSGRNVSDLNDSTQNRPENSSAVFKELSGEQFHDDNENRQIKGLVITFVEVEDNSVTEAQLQNNGQRLDPDEELMQMLTKHIEEGAEMSQQEGTQSNTLTYTHQGIPVTKDLENDTNVTIDNNELAAEQVQPELFDENILTKNSLNSKIGISHRETPLENVGENYHRQEVGFGFPSSGKLRNVPAVSFHEDSANVSSTEECNPFFHDPIDNFEGESQHTEILHSVSPQQSAFQYPGPEQFFLQQPYFPQHQLQLVQAHQFRGVPSQVISCQTTGQPANAYQIASNNPYDRIQLVQGFSGPTSSTATPTVVQTPQTTTRQEQIWRSQPHGPYYRGTRNPKKVVRNAFLNEWLSINRPDIPLPNSSGQGFMEQNQVFGNLSPHEQRAVNAFVVSKVEAEQAEVRRKGRAVYRDIDVKTGKGKAGGTSTNVSGAGTQSATDGESLGRRIAPAPAPATAGYGPQGFHRDFQRNILGNQSMHIADGQAQPHSYPSYLPTMQQRISNQYHPFGYPPGYPNGGPLVTQSFSTSSNHYGQVVMSQNPAMSFVQCDIPMNNVTMPDGTTLGISNTYLTNGSYSQYSSEQRNPMDIVQYGQQMPGYSDSVSRPQSGYQHSPYTNQQPGGRDLIQNLRDQSILGIHNDASGRDVRTGSSPAIGLPHQCVETLMGMNEEAISRKRQQEIGDIGEDEADGGGDYPNNRASKRVRRN
ncbi:hypothetical protein N431DRAFT_465670 [Stipitochalara longipes BDJ]|nr:hypothetical protein N431DRAFT_465670 [Stipitochalara longipes BDJ]